jgi:hypothetical protein
MASFRIARVCGLVCTSLFAASGVGAQALLPIQDRAPALFPWGDWGLQLTIQPVLVPLDPPDEIIEIEPGHQIHGPIELPFPVTIGGVIQDRLYVSTAGFLSFGAPLGEQFGSSNAGLWPNLSITTIALGGDWSVSKYPRRIELRTGGRPGRRVFTVSLVDIPLSSLPGSEHTAHARFEEATGDLALSSVASRRRHRDWWMLTSAWLGLMLGEAVEHFGFNFTTNPGAGLSVTLVLSDCDPATHGDRDADTLVDACDPCPDAFDPRALDRDRDGLGDACDDDPDAPAAGFAKPVGPEADPDADGDGVPDSGDNCPDDTNPEQADEDADELGDVCDACPGDRWEGDPDADGVCGMDNCPWAYNPAQADADGDGFGDVCDECAGPGPLDAEGAPSPSDGDAICRTEDNCPDWPNPDQADRDGDGIGDACEAWPDLSEAPGDDDGVPQALDDCPDDYDPDQRDQDADGVGDACDLDVDGDGVENAPHGQFEFGASPDNCPLAPNGDQADGDEDGIGDACDLGSNFVEILFADGGRGARIIAAVNGQDALDVKVEVDLVGPLRLQLSEALDRLGAPGEGGCVIRFSSGCRTTRPSSPSRWPGWRSSATHPTDPNGPASSMA